MDTATVIISGVVMLGFGLAVLALIAAMAVFWWALIPIIGIAVGGWWGFVTGVCVVMVIFVIIQVIKDMGEDIEKFKDEIASLKEHQEDVGNDD